MTDSEKSLRKILKTFLQETHHPDPYGSFLLCPSVQVKGVTPRHRSRKARLRGAKKGTPSVCSYLMVGPNPEIKFKPFMAWTSLR